MNNDYKLVYVKPLGKNIDEKYEYELYFSEYPDEVWAKDWDDNNPLSCGDISPDEDMCNKIVRFSSNYKFKTIEETSCYSMEYAIDRIVAIAWIDIDGLEEYPQYGRNVLHYGDSFDEVDNLLRLYDVFIDDNE